VVQGRKGGICNGGLSAAKEVEVAHALELRQGDIVNAGLATKGELQALQAFKVHKGPARELRALGNVQALKSGGQGSKGSIREGGLTAASHAERPQPH
jgi:hypothetical protein